MIFGRHLWGAAAIGAKAAITATFAPMPARKAILVIATACVLAPIVGGCGSAPDGGSDRLDVVATTTQVGDWVGEVGGDAVAVHQILQPNTDPHEYEPRPSDVRETADADLVFVSGDQLDAWMEEVVSDSGSDAEVVDLGASVPERLPGEAEGEEASKYDPHWWHDPRNVEAAVREIERRLAATDPAHRQDFARNARNYLVKLRALDAGIAACIDSIPAARRKLVTDHDAFNYFAARYGIDVVGAVIPSQTTAAQPSAQDLTDLIGLIEREGVEAVFPEASLGAKVTEAIADRTGASAEYTLYGDTLGPAGSDGATYLQMERANADAMARGFSGGRHGCR